MGQAYRLPSPAPIVIAHLAVAIAGNPSFVMPGLDPGIHEAGQRSQQYD
jgi:hypothetical protein